VNLEQMEVDSEDSPLVVIKQKEIEINTRILQASRRADEEISAARRKATEIKAKAERDSVEETKRLHREEIKNAKAQAVKIVQGAQKEVKQVTEMGRTNKDRAVGFIMDTVITAEKHQK